MKYTNPDAVEHTAFKPVNGYYGPYGEKIPTSFMLRYYNRWRRVYVVNYGNAGSAYVIRNGEREYLDVETEDRVNKWNRMGA